MVKRKGLGRGLGRGYKNIVPRDPFIHGLSAKGVKTYKIGQTVYLKKTGEKWSIYDRNRKDNTYTIDGGDGLLFYGVKPSEFKQFKKTLNAKDLTREQKMKELKKMLGSDFVDDLEKAVKDIESSVPTTKHHYGKYMAILEKFPRSQWREITALLVFLGANREGLISAVQVLSAKGKVDRQDLINKLVEDASANFYDSREYLYSVLREYLEGKSSKQLKDEFPSYDDFKDKSQIIVAIVEDTMENEYDSRAFLLETYQEFLKEQSDEDLERWL